MRVFHLLLVFLVQSVNMGFSQDSPREQVAELNGKPIYRDELGKGETKNMVPSYLTTLRGFGPNSWSQNG